MHYIDAITSGTEFATSPRERIARATQQRPDYVEDSESFRSLYLGKSFHELQIELAEDEQTEFERQLHIPSGTLASFIMGKLQERITNNPR